MADDADRAQPAIEARLNESIAKRRPELIVVNFCHNCGESAPGKLFCCTECRDDYDYRRSVKNKTGG